jgi:hypothetical protein
MISRSRIGSRRSSDYVHVGNQSHAQKRCFLPAVQKKKKSFFVRIVGRGYGGFTLELSALTGEERSACIFDCLLVYGFL